MRVLATSDLHVDHAENMQWVRNLSKYDFVDDVLLLAGDISDRYDHLSEVFSLLVSRFSEVLFVPGNHDLWVIRCKTESSLKKYHHVMNLAVEQGVKTDVTTLGALTLVPLYSWYDYSFGRPEQKLSGAWSDYFACKWPADMDEAMITKMFLDQNEPHLNISNETVISFSHFLPTLDVLSKRIPAKYNYLHPIFGSKHLGAQIARLKPDIHVYGHSHINRDVVIEDIRYVNNALAYPREKHLSRNQLLVIHET